MWLASTLPSYTIKKCSTVTEDVFTYCNMSFASLFVIVFRKFPRNLQLLHLKTRHNATLNNIVTNYVIIAVFPPKTIIKHNRAWSGRGLGVV